MGTHAISTVGDGDLTRITSDQGGKRPIGVVLWGLLSDEVDARLTAGTTRLSK